MLGRLLHPPKKLDVGLASSSLYDQDTFYPALLNDIRTCRSELVIESPFITSRRTSTLLPVLCRLKARKARIIINTRDPLANEDEYYRLDSFEAVARLQAIGAEVFYTGAHHRKLVIVDRSVLYEGSLNPLSQNDSCEVMRRISSTQLASEMIQFVGVDSYAA